MTTDIIKFREKDERTRVIYSGTSQGASDVLCFDQKRREAEYCKDYCTQHSITQLEALILLKNAATSHKSFCQIMLRNERVSDRLVRSYANHVLWSVLLSELMENLHHLILLLIRLMNEKESLKHKNPLRSQDFDVIRSENSHSIVLSYI